jgi:hypothetical protein
MLWIAAVRKAMSRNVSDGGRDANPMWERPRLKRVSSVWVNPAVKLEKCVTIDKVRIRQPPSTRDWR